MIPNRMKNEDDIIHKTFYMGIKNMSKKISTKAAFYDLSNLMLLNELLLIKKCKAAC